MDSPESILGSYASGLDRTLDGEPVIGAVTSIGGMSSQQQQQPSAVPEVMSPSPLVAIPRLQPQLRQPPVMGITAGLNLKKAPHLTMTTVSQPTNPPVMMNSNWPKGSQLLNHVQLHPRIHSSSAGSSSSTEVPSTSPVNISLSSPSGQVPLPDFNMRPFQRSPDGGATRQQTPPVFHMETSLSHEPSHPHPAQYLQHSAVYPPAAAVVPHQVRSAPSYPKISSQEAGDRIVQRITMTHSLNKPAKMMDPDSPNPITLPSHAFDPLPSRPGAPNNSRSPRPGGGLFAYSVPPPLPRTDKRLTAAALAEQQQRERMLLGRETLMPPGTDDEILSLADLDRKLSIAYSSVSKPKKHSKGHHRTIKAAEPSAPRRRYSAEEQKRGGGWFGSWGRNNNVRDDSAAAKRRHSVPTRQQRDFQQQRRKKSSRENRGRRPWGAESTADDTTHDDARSSLGGWSSAVSSIEESFFDSRRWADGKRRHGGHYSRRMAAALVGGSRKYLPPVEYLARPMLSGVAASLPMHPMLPPGPSPAGPPMLMDAMEISPVASRSMLTCNTEFRKQYPYVYQALCKGILDVQKLIAHEIVIPIKEDVALKRSAIRSRKAVTGAICDQLWRSLQGRFPDPQVAPKLIKKIADYFYDKVEFGIQDAEDERSFLQWLFRFEVENAVDLRQNITIVAGKNTAICNLEGSGRLKRKKGEFFNVISPDQVLLNIECVIKALFLNGGHLQEINMDTIFVDRVASGQNLFARNFIGY